MTPETQAFVVTMTTLLTPVLLAVIAYKQIQLTRTLAETSQTIAQTGKTIETLEKNTNSIKDALVRTTGDEAHARGVLDEKTRQKEIDMKVEEAKKIAP